MTGWNQWIKPSSNNEIYFFVLKLLALSIRWVLRKFKCASSSLVLNEGLLHNTAVLFLFWTGQILEMMGTSSLIPGPRLQALWY